MSIKKLLLLGFGAAIGLSLLIAVMGYNSAQKSTAQIEELVNYDMAFREQILELKNALLMHRRFEKDIFLNIGKPQKQQKYLQKIHQVSEETRKQINALSELSSGVVELSLQQRTLIKTFSSSYARYINGVHKVADKAIGANTSAVEANRLMIPYKSPIHEMETSLSTLASLSHTLLIEEGNESLSVMQQSENMIITACIVAVILGLFIAFVVFRSINKPLEELTLFANRIADGDLNAKNSSAFSGEIRVLYTAIDRMVHELKEKLGFAQGVLNAIPTPCGVVLSAQISTCDGLTNNCVLCSKNLENLMTTLAYVLANCTGMIKIERLSLIRLLKKEDQDTLYANVR